MSDELIKEESVTEHVVDPVPPGTIVQDGVIIEERPIVDPMSINPITRHAKISKGSVRVDENGNNLPRDVIEEAHADAERQSIIANELANIFGDSATIFTEAAKPKKTSNSDVTITRVSSGQPLTPELRKHIGLE